jgi:putative transposase
MRYDPAKHHRRSIRLKGYDYASPGAYFVTICVQDRECILGTVTNSEMRLNTDGRTVDEFWYQVPVHFSNVSVDAHVTMPNHVHDTRRGAVTAPDVSVSTNMETSRKGGVSPPLQPPSRSAIDRPVLGQIVAYYKYQTTKVINQMHDTPGARFWQRNYWEHIIRDEHAFQRICQYVQNNSACWEDDQLHPDAPPNPFNRG